MYSVPNAVMLLIFDVKCRTVVGEHVGLSSWLAAGARPGEQRAGNPRPLPGQPGDRRVRSRRPLPGQPGDWRVRSRRPLPGQPGDSAAVRSTPRVHDFFWDTSSAAVYHEVTPWKLVWAAMISIDLDLARKETTLRMTETRCSFRNKHNKRECRHEGRVAWRTLAGRDRQVGQITLIRGSGGHCGWAQPIGKAQLWKERAG